MANHELDQLRKQVDEINLQLLHLLNKRGEIVQKIGEQKQVQGTKRFDPVREREVLDNDRRAQRRTIRNVNSSTYFQNNLQS